MAVDNCCKTCGTLQRQFQSSLFAVAPITKKLKSTILHRHTHTDNTVRCVHIVSLQLLDQRKNKLALRLLWLQRLFWAKLVLERFSGPELGPSMILFLVGASAVHIWCCSNQVEVGFWLFRSSGSFIVCCQKEGPSAFCSVRWLLKVFLAVAEFVDDRAGGRLVFEWLHWILYCPLLAPLAPLDSRLLPKFSARKEQESWSFQSTPLLINCMDLKTGWSKNLLRERSGKVKSWRLSSSVIVSISCQLH